MLNDSISNIRIDINGESARSGIYVRQGDTKSRSIHVSLVDHGQVISLENAIVAELLIAKTDGFECDQGMVIVGNELQYTFRTNDLSTLGANKAQVMVTFDDGAVLTSPKFIINVYAKEVNQKYQESFNEYTALTQNVAKAFQYAKQAENSADKAESYESTFKTMRDEAVTASANATASATSAADALSRAQAYVDNAIAELINGAPTTLDTLKEIADAMAESQEVINALDAAIGTKADVTALNNHVNNTNIHVTMQDKVKWDAITALEQRISTLESMIGYPINLS